MAAKSPTNRFAVFDLGKEDPTPPKTIFEAAERGNVTAITRMLERTIDFDINQKDSLQRTALHWAAEMGHLKAAEALIDFGIGVGLTECNGRTAIHLAARAANAEMISALLQTQDPASRETLVNQSDNFGITPVFLTLQKGDEGRPAFEVLMANGAKYSDMTTSKAPGMRQ